MNNVHPIFEPILNSLRHIDTTELDKSVESLGRMQTEVKRAMKISRKVTTVEKIEVDLSLPAFFKSDTETFFYKIDEDESVLEVTAAGSRVALMLTKKGDLFYETTLSSATGKKPCRPKEFYEAYQKALQILETF